jgi:protease-4
MNSWRKHVPWALVAVAFFIFVATVGMVGILSSGGDAVGLIKIKGRISDSRAAIQQLHRLNDNPLVKALVIDLDCPGCPLASAQSLFEEIKKIQRQGKPVLVAVDQICLGGGYYLACGAKCIFANPGSLTCIINERVT